MGLTINYDLPRTNSDDELEDDSEGPMPFHEVISAIGKNFGDKQHLGRREQDIRYVNVMQVQSSDRIGPTCETNKNKNQLSMAYYVYRYIFSSVLEQ